jgi:hypothetical protein
MKGFGRYCGKSRTEVTVHVAAITPARVPRYGCSRPSTGRRWIVVLDGAAGKQLRGRQAAIMRKVLRWLRDNPRNPGDDADGMGEPIGRFDIA